ncbi:protein MENT [Heteronotia binoei]|uniref:protein MENT n=1 Tax=Heteronotia binoei TaxID=13085 RepID=UPI00292F3F0F|nr:protein MENT [Heteronotia binoei]
MAIGGGLLPLLLWLWPACLGPDLSVGGHQVGEHEDVLIAAPPHLIDLLPAAATATVAAGYIPGDTSLEESQVAVATSEGIPVMVMTVQTTTEESKAPSPGKVDILIVGDTRYQWQDWSPWHCNCPQGSMSRVRDITYSTPGVVLDPAQYDVLRFQRVVCDYKICHCRPEEHQCDRLEVTCAEEEHVCALRDIEQDQHQKRKDFWARLHAELKNLWQSLKDAFPRIRKESTAKSTR